MKYTTIAVNDDNTYSIYFSDAFYTLVKSTYHNESYFNIYYRLFGLLPQDFYHYVGATYNAKFVPCPHLQNLIYMRFTTKQFAELFCKEVDKRITYFANRGDFT